MPQDNIPAGTGKHPVETIAIIAAAIITAVLTALSLTVFKDPGFHLDLDFLLALQHFRENSHILITRFFEGVTYLGTGQVAFLTLILVYFGFSSRTGMFLVQVFGYSCMVNGFLKLAVGALRPWIRDDLIVPAGHVKTAATGFSFPSGHTTNATAVFGGLAARIGPGKLYLFAGCLIVVLLVLFSRNFLGVHTPQDVIVGFLSALAIVLLMNKIFRWLSSGDQRSQGRKKGLLFLISALVSILAAVFFECRSYPEVTNAAGKLIVKPAKMVQDSYQTIGLYLGASFTLFFQHYFRGYAAENATWRQRVIVTALAAVLALLVHHYLIGSLKEFLPLRFAKAIGNFFTVFGVFGLLPALFARLGYGVSGDAKPRES